MATVSCHFAVVVDIPGPARRTTGARTGGRSERVVASVLSAALTELAHVGYVALRLEDVATRAGVAKTTVYRRWPTKPELVRDAVTQTVTRETPLPDTGSLRTDMLVLLERTMALMSTPEGMAVARLITTESVDPDVEELCRSLREQSRSHRASVVVRAQERGELPAAADPMLITDSIFVFPISRLIRYGERIDRSTCEQLIDLVVTGAEHGGGQRARVRRRG